MPTITLKNYRPFLDGDPLRICLDPGFTALLGPNNAGKSSLLRFIYECRNLWQTLREAQRIADLINTGQGIAIHGVGDAVEIFAHSNARPITIDIEFAPVGFDGLTRTVISMQRPTGGSHVHARLQMYSTSRPEPAELVSVVQAPFDGTMQPAIQARDARVIDVRPLMSFADDMARTIYVGPFRNAITEGKASYFDLAIGTTFIEAWHDLKTGASRLGNERAVRVEDDIARIFRFSSVEINAAEDNQSLQVRLDRRPYKLRELGGGLAQFIVTFGNMARLSPSYILLDEPELNLHPALQLDFLTSLASYAERGIIFATHSVGLARASAERIYSFRHGGDGSVVRSFEQTSTLAEFIGEMSFTSYRELGFDAILLVEGVTDVKTVQQFLRRLRKDHSVVLLPLGGDQMARGDTEHELLEVKRISNSIFALVDSERASADEPAAARRLAFADTCKRVDIPCLLTERRALENYLTDAAVKAAFGNRYRALGPFEVLRDVTPAWSKASSWLAAREMSETDLLSTDVGRFLHGIESSST